MAEPGPSPRPPRPPAGGWIAATVILLTALAVGPLVLLFASGDPPPIAEADIAYISGRVVGTIALPLLLAAPALLLRRRRGPVFFAIALGLFLLSTLGRIAG